MRKEVPKFFSAGKKDEKRHKNGKLYRNLWRLHKHGKDEREKMLEREKKEKREKEDKEWKARMAGLKTTGKGSPRTVVYSSKNKGLEFQLSELQKRDQDLRSRKLT